MLTSLAIARHQTTVAARSKCETSRRSSAAVGGESPRNFHRCDRKTTKTLTKSPDDSRFQKKSSIIRINRDFVCRAIVLSPSSTNRDSLFFRLVAFVFSSARLERNGQRASALTIHAGQTVRSIQSNLSIASIAPPPLSGHP